MKGIILAGGLGTRLLPITKITNKHLLPIYDKPMIYYPLATLSKSGIKDIIIVTGGQHYNGFVQLLGYGKEFGLPYLAYTYQDGEGGIAEALGLAKSFVGKDRVCVILGDNILQKDIYQIVQEFERQSKGARVVLKKVLDPHRFGVAEIKDYRIIGLEEKPKEPKSDFAVIGVYFYDEQVWDIIPTLKAGPRGELEITDVNKAYMEMGQLEYSVLDGWWLDAGTIASLYKASTTIKDEYGL